MDIEEIAGYVDGGVTLTLVRIPYSVSYCILIWKMRKMG